MSWPGAGTPPTPALNQVGGPSFSFDLGAANAALKELYDDQRILNLVYKNNPFLAMVPKMEEFGGKYMPIPLIVNTSQGRSATFSTAQANQTAATIESFALTRKSNYSIAQIDNQTMLASKTDKMAFINGATAVIDNAIKAITNNLATQLFGSGKGTIGVISASSTLGNIVLTNASDVVAFEVNMVLEARDPGTGALRTGGPAYVVGVNRSTGVVQVSGTMGGTAGVGLGSWAAAALDTLNVQGDYNLALSGLAAWLPQTAPTTGDNFFGVDRSIDPTRLAGVRYDGSSQTIEEALIDGSLLVAREGGNPDVAMLNYASYAALEKSLGSKAQYIGFKGPAEIMFPGILINGAAGQIKVFPDRSATAKTAYLLQMDTWKMYSLGPAPHIAKYADGLEMLRVYNSDAAELRVVSYANLGCNAPGFNGVIKLGA